MAKATRTQLLTKLQKVLKQNYKAVLPDTGRPVLEQVLFACCLENAGYEAAEKAFTRLGENYFDLNEVRVTTVAELAEALQPLPDPSRAALSLRRVLQSVFESTYSYSLEHARKGSIANGIKTLQGLQGVPGFVTSFVVSTGLGGHAIPLDDGALGVLLLGGLITQEEYDAREVPWLERAIPKKAGKEFASLLHQFGADVVGKIHSPELRKLILAINPDAKDLFPKRGASLTPPQPAEAAAGISEDHRPAGPQPAARPVGKTPMPPPGSGPKRTADGKSGKSGPKPFVVKPNMARPLTIKPETEETPAAEEKPKAAGKKASSAAADAAPAAKKAVAKKAVTKKAVTKKAPPAKKVAAKKTGKTSAAKAKKSSGKASAKTSGGGHSQQLAKRKPR